MWPKWHNEGSLGRGNLLPAGNFWAPPGRVFVFSHSQGWQLDPFSLERQERGWGLSSSPIQPPAADLAWQTGPTLATQDLPAISAPLPPPTTAFLRTASSAAPETP